MKKMIFVMLIAFLNITQAGYAQVSENYVSNAMSYPTGQTSTSILLLEKMYPKKGRIGQTYAYKIKVTNLTNFDLQSVKITEEIPESFDIESTQPRYDNKVDDQYIWRIGDLAAKSSVVIEVKGSGTTKDSSPCCTTADYVLPALCHKTILENPALSIRIEAPDTKFVCDPLPLTLLVKNTGDSYLDDVIVQVPLPYGIKSLTDKSMLYLKAGGLAVGESKTVNAHVKATETGTYAFTAKATSNDVTATAADQRTNVLKPELAITARANKQEQYIGRPIEFTFDVKNVSDMDAKETIVRANIPTNTVIKSIGNQGRITGDVVEWQLGTLSGYDSKTVGFIAEAKSFGRAETKVVAKADCCNAVSATENVVLAGIPALLLEVVDLVDPIEVGDIETYVIKVTNQGTAVAHNVEIDATLEGMSYVSSSGETRGSASGNRVNFAPIGQLGAKEEVTWTIKVSGDQEGDLRFRVSLNSDELTRPVEEAESTFVY